MSATETVTEKAKQLLKESSLTYEEVGIRMGYPLESARQNVWNFLNGKNPSMAMVKRFAEAIAVDVTELL